MEAWLCLLFLCAVQVGHLFSRMNGCINVPVNKTPTQKEKTAAETRSPVAQVNCSIHHWSRWMLSLAFTGLSSYPFLSQQQ